MISSDVRRITFRRKPAELEVLRNNGYCWGRITTESGEEFDVYTRKDWYEQDDDEALDAFERASRNPKCLSPASGWHREFGAIPI